MGQNVGYHTGAIHNGEIIVAVITIDCVHIAERYGQHLPCTRVTGQIGSKRAVGESAGIFKRRAGLAVNTDQFDEFQPDGQRIGHSNVGRNTLV